MKYGMDFQYLPKGAGRPLDDGEVVPIETDENGFALIPNVGDFVGIDASAIDGNGFSGRVKIRLFRLSLTHDLTGLGSTRVDRSLNHSKTRGCPYRKSHPPRES